jgi:FMN phosphatase YigB (HAD superfamily)
MQLVCFDLGRVLVRICDGWRHAFQVAGAGELKGAPPASLEAVVHELELGRISVAAFVERVAAALAVGPEPVHAVVDAFLLGLYPRTGALLGALQRAGVPTACLSNTNARHWALMAEFRQDGALFFERFRYRFASHELGVRKPAAEAYAQVEQVTGASPREIVFFDDLLDNVAAARARGWQAHQVDPARDPIEQIELELTRLGVLGLGPTDSRRDRRR